MRVLSAIPNLAHLHLCNFEPSEQALNKFWADSNRALEELTLQGLLLSAESLSSLHSFTSLKALGISNCLQVRVGMLLASESVDTSGSHKVLC